MTEITWKYVKALAKKNAVEEFEKKNNLSYPNDLKECIKTYNGGRPSKNVFDTNDTKGRVFKTLLSFNESDVENIFKFFPVNDSQFHDLVPFASDPSGNYLCLKDTKIVLYLHETDQLENISDMFSDLLKNLHD